MQLLLSRWGHCKIVEANDELTRLAVEKEKAKEWRAEMKLKKLKP